MKGTDEIASVVDDSGNCIIHQGSDEQTLITFTNRFTSGLTLQKFVVSDDDWNHKSFRFTLTLKDADGEPLTGKPFQQNNGAINFVEESAGVYTFQLKNLEEVTLSLIHI